MMLPMISSVSINTCSSLPGAGSDHSTVGFSAGKTNPPPNKMMTVEDCGLEELAHAHKEEHQAILFSATALESSYVMWIGGRV